MFLRNTAVMRKLIIFTADTNLSVRKVYESLGVIPVGYYALLFGMKDLDFCFLSCPS